MYKEFKIKPPFFEIEPKAFLYGEGMLKLAKVIDKQRQSTTLMSL